MKSRLAHFIRFVGAGAVSTVGLLHCNTGTKIENVEDDIVGERFICKLTSKFQRSGIFLEAKGAWGINEVDMSHGTKWDKNWDLRTAESLVKPLKKDATEEEVEEYNKKLEEKKSKAIRVLLLVRHGQYNMEGKDDSERYLTDVGKQQANLTGQRLRAVLHKHLEDKKDENGNIVKPKVTIHNSTMTRATQTADIIHSHLPDLQIKSCDLLPEGAPCPPDPPLSRGAWDVGPEDFFVEGSRIEAAFRKYFHRADPEQSEESVDILVCHGNVIRYFICRALQLDPSAWFRMSILNGSITMIVIRASGNVSVRQVGEGAHFPPYLQTFN